MKNMVSLPRVATSLALDYVRWTQLVPMILVWSMLLAMSFVLLFAYNEEAAWSIVELAIRTVQSLPFIGDRFTLWMESQTSDGVFSPDLGAVDWKEFALQAWAWLSLGFMLVGAVLRRVLGPLPEFTLRRKLALAGIACGVVVTGFMLLFLIDGKGEGGWYFLSAFASACGFGLVLFIISAWCLGIAHALGFLSRAVMNPDYAPGEDSPAN